MAYEFSREHRTVWWPVVVRVPLDGGDVLESEFELQFEIPKRSEWKELEALPKDEADARGMAFIRGWRGIEETGGERAAPVPVPFSRKNLEALMEDSFFSAAVHRAMLQASMGARAKN